MANSQDRPPHSALVIGHEAAGDVVETGARVPDLRPGDQGDQLHIRLHGVLWPAAPNGTSTGSAFSTKWRHRMIVYETCLFC